MAGQTRALVCGFVASAPWTREVKAAWAWDDVAARKALRANVLVVNGRRARGVRTRPQMCSEREEEAVKGSVVEESSQDLGQEQRSLEVALDAVLPEQPQAAAGAFAGKSVGKAVGSSVASSVGSGVGVALGSMAGAMVGKALGKSVAVEASAVAAQSERLNPQQIVAQSVARHSPSSLNGKLRRLWHTVLVFFGFQASSAQLSGMQKLRKYGIAAIISYGMFDAVTYSLSFLLALKTFTIKTGRPLCWATFPQVFALMWGINNFSRPFRIAGALLLSPFVDQYIVQPVRKLTARKTLN
ncbi:hypothetical protein FVE85_0848 [Porphyridium purpureum]|uniref:Uncharacterized protein n=1 Tax=Porphyridium purpureum TaxID=35688 RepID=A0A5J4YZR7_PORPP|nr:hypothetical protein FVE85_0848 [Porphyridium purpureum]|eukprot:POR1168..scf208_2